MIRDVAKKLLVAGAILLAVPTMALATITVSGPYMGYMQDSQGRIIANDSYAYVRWDWSTGAAETAASDSNQTAVITGRIVGVKAVEGSIDTAYTIKLLDSAGRDVLQGLFSDTEASATATADSHYRVPVDDTSGGPIVLINETVYGDISSAGNSNSGYFIVIIKVK